MGSEIARAVAIEGYHVIMASKNLERAEEKRKWIISESGNEDVEIIPIDLSSLKTVNMPNNYDICSHPACVLSAMRTVQVPYHVLP